MAWCNKDQMFCGGVLATGESENCKLADALEILRRAVTVDDSTPLTSENTVQKKEKVILRGNEVTVRRIYIVYGAYRIGWVLNADVNFCMECEAEFNFLKRKHHCRACGIVVCSICSLFRLDIPAISEIGGSRVCVNCFGLKVKMSVMKPIDPDVSPTRSVGNRANGSEVTAETACNLTARELIRDRTRKARKEQAQQQLEEAARKPLYQRAYRTMRCIVPPDVAETSLQDMFAAGLPSPVARRVWKCRCLWLLSMHHDDIKKIHIADFRSKYAPVGLDLVELRAVWYVLPDWCEDKDPEKCAWKINFRQQMDDLARREENGTAAEHLKRNEVYEGYEPLRVYSSNTVIRRRYSCANGAAVDSEANSASSSGDATCDVEAGSVDELATPTRGNESNDATGGALPVQTGEEWEDLSPRSLNGPRSLVDIRRDRCYSNFEKVRSFSYSPPWRSLSSNAGQTTSMGSEKSTYRRRREEERRRRMTSGGSGLSSGEESCSPVVSPSGETKKVTELTKSSRYRPRSNSPYRPAHKRNVPTKQKVNGLKECDRSCIRPTTANNCIPKLLTHGRTVSQLFSPIDDDDIRPDGSESESESSDVPSDGAPVRVVCAGTNRLTPGNREEPPPHSCRQTSTSSDTDDNYIPLAAHVPLFLSSQEDSAFARLASSSLSTSPVPNSTQSALIERCSSSGTATALSLSRRGKESDGLPPTTVVDCHEHPPLTATPLRHMMGTLDSCEVASRVQQSALKMSPSEATDLLKYALVNFCDVDEEGLPHDRKRTEDGIILIINNMVERCRADVNAVDREGNSLLTFILEYSHSGRAAVAEGPGARTGIHTLIRCLVFHGINIFMSYKDMSTTCHEGFLLLQPQDLNWLTEKFRRRCIIRVEGRDDPGRPDLSKAQYWNFFAVLVASGQIEAAAFLLDKEKVLLSPARASALLKACKFETMNNAIETYEFLEQHGGQL